MFLYATKPKDVWSLRAGPSPNIVSVVSKASAGSMVGRGREGMTLKNYLRSATYVFRTCEHESHKTIIFNLHPNGYYCFTITTISLALIFSPDIFHRYTYYIIIIKISNNSIPVLKPVVQVTLHQTLTFSD